MKKCYFFILVSLLFYSCNNNANNEVNTEDTVFMPYHWEATDTGRIVMKRIDGIGPDTVSPKGVVTYLNNNWPTIQLSIVKISGDTLYLKIPQATYLTQQMGSSGPKAYFAQAVYNLTEIPGIHYVNFDFAEGDHARPYTYSKENLEIE